MTDLGLALASRPRPARHRPGQVPPHRALPAQIGGATGCLVACRSDLEVMQGRCRNGARSGYRAAERIAGLPQHRVVRPAGVGESATARAVPLHLAIKNQRIEDGTHRATGPGLQQRASVAAARPIQQGEVLAGVVGHHRGPHRQSCDQRPQDLGHRVRRWPACARLTSVVMPWTAVPPSGIAMPGSAHQLSSLAPPSPRYAVTIRRLIAVIREPLPPGSRSGPQTGFQRLACELRDRLALVGSHPRGALTHRRSHSECDLR